MLDVTASYGRPFDFIAFFGYFYTLLTYLHKKNINMLKYLNYTFLEFILFYNLFTKFQSIYFNDLIPLQIGCYMDQTPFVNYLEN